MKKILITIAALGLFASAANAQTYAAQSLTVNSTNNIAAAVTNTVNAVLDVRKQKDVAVAISFLMTTSGTDYQYLTFDRSVDNVNWNTLAADQTVVRIAATGATLTTTVTNLQTYGCGFMRLKTWGNAGAATAATNVVVKYGIKIAAP